MYVFEFIILLFVLMTLMAIIGIKYQIFKEDQLDKEKNRRSIELEQQRRQRENINRDWIKSKWNDITTKN